MSRKGLGQNSRLAAVAWLLVLLIGSVLLATVWRKPILSLFGDSARLAAFVQKLGPAGPLAIIALQMAQVIVSPIPGQVVGLASGYLYGSWLGTLYSMIGLMLGTAVAVWLARRWGRPLVERLVGPDTLARVDRFAARLGAPLLFLVFLVPFLPDDAILLVAGLGDVPLPGILFAALVGRLPGVLVSAWLGQGATELTPLQWAVVAAVTILVAAPVYYFRGRIERTAWSLLERISRRRRVPPQQVQ